jgi:hypothetical protein
MNLLGMKYNNYISNVKSCRFDSSAIIFIQSKKTFKCDRLCECGGMRIEILKNLKRRTLLYSVQLINDRVRKQKIVPHMHPQTTYLVPFPDFNNSKNPYPNNIERMLPRAIISAA